MWPVTKTVGPGRAVARWFSVGGRTRDGEADRDRSAMVGVSVSFYFLLIDPEWLVASRRLDVGNVLLWDVAVYLCLLTWDVPPFILATRCAGPLGCPVMQESISSAALATLHNF